MLPLFLRCSDPQKVYTEQSSACTGPHSMGDNSAAVGRVEDEQMKESPKHRTQACSDLGDRVLPTILEAESPDKLDLPTESVPGTKPGATGGSDEPIGREPLVSKSADELHISESAGDVVKEKVLVRERVRTVSFIVFIHDCDRVESDAKLMSSHQLDPMSTGGNCMGWAIIGSQQR